MYIRVGLTLFFFVVAPFRGKTVVRLEKLNVEKGKRKMHAAPRMYVTTQSSTCNQSRKNKNVNGQNRVHPMIFGPKRVVPEILWETDCRGQF